MRRVIGSEQPSSSLSVTTPKPNVYAAHLFSTQVISPWTLSPSDASLAQESSPSLSTKPAPQDTEQVLRVCVLSCSLLSHGFEAPPLTP